MTDTPDEALVEVTQADREAAADAVARMRTLGKSSADYARTLDGRNDGFWVVQAFARHRLATLPAAAPADVVERIGQVIIELLPSVVIPKRTRDRLAKGILAALPKPAEQGGDVVGRETAPKAWPGQDAPDMFEAWWADNQWREREAVNYNDRKCIAWAGFWAAHQLAATALAARDEELERLREDRFNAVVAAYEQGALDVHNNWQEDRNPDFYEAAHDYARSLLGTGEAGKPVNEGEASA